MSAWFGGGPEEKDPRFTGTSPAAYPVRREAARKRTCTTGTSPCGPPIRQSVRSVALRLPGNRPVWQVIDVYVSMRRDGGAARCGLRQMQQRRCGTQPRQSKVQRRSAWLDPHTHLRHAGHAYPVIAKIFRSAPGETLSTAYGESHAMSAAAREPMAFIRSSAMFFLSTSWAAM